MTLDGDGYPFDEDLDKIKAWPPADLRGLVAFARERWAYPEYWTETEADGGIEIRASTGGWSGNESVIGALRGNTMFWLICWQESRRGGGYTFLVPAPP